MDATLIDLVEREVKPLPKRPEGFGMTVQEYASAKQMSINAARRILLDAVAAGVLERREMIVHKGKGAVFFKKGAKVA